MYYIFIFMQRRISATIDPNIHHFLQQIMKELKLGQSAVIERALKLLQAHYLQQKMKEGYLVDAGEALDFAQAAQKITSINDEV